MNNMKVFVLILSVCILNASCNPTKQSNEKGVASRHKRFAPLIAVGEGILAIVLAELGMRIADRCFDRVVDECVKRVGLPWYLTIIPPDFASVTACVSTYAVMHRECIIGEKS